jgi:uncharacterized membrane-anchored protein
LENTLTWPRENCDREHDENTAWRTCPTSAQFFAVSPVFSRFVAYFWNAPFSQGKSLSVESPWLLMVLRERIELSTSPLPKDISPTITMT